MRKLSFIAVFLISLTGWSQHSTLRFTNEPINLNRQSLLLIPFESKMFLTDINRELAIHNDMNSKEIVDRFSTAIDQSILYTFQERCDISSFYQNLEGEYENDLVYIYDNLRLEYELVSKTEEQSRTDKLKAKFKKKEDDRYQRGQIQGGQIITKRDDRVRYMKAVVQNNKMLDSMHFKFNNKFFLFITQLDIMNDYSDAIAMQNMEYSRIIQLHYTLYHRNGEILSTGISKTTFPATLNDIDDIIQTYFPKITKNIFDALFPPEDEEIKKSKVNLTPWKQ